MVLDSLIVGATVLGAVGFLVWHFVPKARPKGPCSACPAKARHG